MVSCSIITCKNVLTRSYFGHTGITFHRFPKDPGIRDKWIATTGRKNWTPVDDRICSEHFKEKDFIVASQRRILMITGVPTIKICSPETSDNSPSTTLPLATKLPSTVSVKRVCTNQNTTKETTSTESDDSDANASEEESDDYSPPPIKLKKTNSSESNFEKNVMKYLKNINKKIDQDKCSLYTKLLHKRLMSLKEDTMEIAMIEIDKYVLSLKQHDDGVATVQQLPQLEVLYNDQLINVKRENDCNGEVDIDS